MPDYNIEIQRKVREGKDGDTRSELWAEITDLATGTTMNKRIWWEDDDGLYHDETPNLPLELREQIDNAWIEKKDKI